MARKPTAKQEFVLFNVHYEDGTMTSNRRIPAAEIGGYEGEAAAKAYFEAQDRDIAEKSGRPRASIKSVERARSR